MRDEPVLVRVPSNALAARPRRMPITDGLTFSTARIIASENASCASSG
jgi:hypothetical protein